MGVHVNELLEGLGRRIRLGMVGGGADSVIGETHRIAFRADGLFELTAGAMSIDPEIAVATARAELLDTDRTHTDYREMAAAEAQRDDGIDAVVIATPPQTHLDIARVFLAAGIDVICEKPMTRDAQEAELLVSEVERSDRLFVLTHCYTGYPMVRHARELVRAGAIGAVRVVEAEFAGGGFAREPADASRRHWRFRRESMGPAVILGEVGSHAHNIIEYVTDSRVRSVSARLDTIAQRREVYDNAYLTVEFDSGAVGRIWSSYVAVGSEHGLSFRIFGDEGSLVWRQEEPEFLWHQQFGGPVVRLSRGMESLSAASLRSSRVPPGHPEGYLLAFANLYRDYARAFVARHRGDRVDDALELVPGARDGLATMRMIDAAAEAANTGSTVTLADPDGPIPITPLTGSKS
jgi:predicted dehydrogenase